MPVVKDIHSTMEKKSTFFCRKKSGMYILEKVSRRLNKGLAVGVRGVEHCFTVLEPHGQPGLDPGWPKCACTRGHGRDPDWQTGERILIW